MKNAPQFFALVQGVSENLRSIFVFFDVPCIRASFFSVSAVDDGVSLFLSRIFRKLFIDELVEPFLCFIAGKMEQRLEGATRDEMVLCQIGVKRVDNILALILL